MAVRQAVICAGLGFRAGASRAQLGAALEQALAEHGRRLDEVRALCVADFKRDDAELRALAEQLGRPLRLAPLTELAALATPTQSSEQLRRYGVGSLSEACALAGALSCSRADPRASTAHGGSARLLGPRLIAGSVTCALAIFTAIPPSPPPAREGSGGAAQR